MKNKAQIDRIKIALRKILHPKGLWVCVAGTKLVRMIGAHARRIRFLCKKAKILGVSKKLIAYCINLSKGVFMGSAVGRRFKFIEELVGRIRKSLRRVT